MDRRGDVDGAVCGRPQHRNQRPGEMEAGHLEWHSMEWVNPKIHGILDCWIGAALQLLECGLQADVECHMALQKAALQMLENPN